MDAGVRPLVWDAQRRVRLPAEVAAYQQRVSRRWRAHDQPLRPAPRSAASQPLRACAQEADTVRQRCPRPCYLVLLDEHGDRLTSTALAARLRRCEDDAVAHVVFVVGSDLGLHPNLRAEADLTLSLSDMTLPHRIARLVLWEQLYRAVDILCGGRYHRTAVQ